MMRWESSDRWIEPRLTLYHFTLGDDVSFLSFISLTDISNSIKKRKSLNIYKQPNKLQLQNLRSN